MSQLPIYDCVRLPSDFAARTQVREHDVDALLVDGAHAGVRNAQADPAPFALDPEAAVLKVGQETPPRLVVCMGNVVPEHRLLAGDLTHPRHETAPDSKSVGFYRAFRAGSIGPATPRRTLGAQRS